MSDMVGRLVYSVRHPRQALRRLRSGQALPDRYTFEVEAVAQFGPEGNAQSYLDRQSIRRYLRWASAERPLRRAVEVGCGYGRVAMALAEFAEETIGVEREPHLVALAQAMFPQIRFIQQPSILRLPPLDDGSCDFVMAFTVLQHMVDEDCRTVLEEIKRVCRPGGFILLAEKERPGDETLNRTDRTQFLSTHRPVAIWEQWMAPCTLLEAVERPVHPLWRRNPGGLMFFGKPGAAAGGEGDRGAHAEEKARDSR